MAESLLAKYPAEIQSLTLVPSGGGVFEVEVNGALIYSKLQTKRHAETGEVEAAFHAHLDSSKAERTGI